MPTISEPARRRAAAILSDLTDDELIDTMADLDDVPDIPDRALKLAMAGEEVRRRPFGRYVMPDEDASDATDAAWAHSRWLIFGDLPERETR